ncbi:MAG: hypothetical protein J5J06_09590 [Phycisphaerae bacterium]|nr:hypothetical protein [Phycisphaerae bacterium]
MARIKELEPQQLRSGKAFHRHMQANWKAQAQGDVAIEKATKMLRGKAGRMDVFVTVDGSEVRAIV